MSTAKQDDLDSPLTRHIRAAMRAIDKIAATDEIDWRERNQAMLRIQKYALTVRDDIRHKAEREEDSE